MGEWLDTHRDEFFQKYSDEEIIKDIQEYMYGKGRLHLYFRHFYEEVVYKSVGAKGAPLNKNFPQRTPMEALESDEFVEFALNYCKEHSDFFTDKMSDCAKMKCFFQNKRPRKVANFPPREARRLIFSKFPDYDLFDEPLNIHDPSSGFGSRQASVLLNGCNYYSTDVNAELHSKLKDAYAFMKKHHLTRGKCDLRLQGSEERIEEWKEKMDISFTSPPYFNLEIYSSDKAKSTKNYDNYSLWVEEYMRPTCENILYYLKPCGYAMINIKNLSKKEPIFDDFVKTFLELGMKRLPDEHLHISSKSWNNEETFLEPVMVFQKV